MHLEHEETMGITREFYHVLTDHLYTFEGMRISREKIEKRRRLTDADYAILARKIHEIFRVVVK